MKLELLKVELYRVKRGQTLTCVARTFGVPPRVLAAENGLQEELREGQYIKIPPNSHHLYEVRGGESRKLLCGSDERFLKLNKTECLYPFQLIFL